MIIHEDKAWRQYCCAIVACRRRFRWYSVALGLPTLLAAPARVGDRDGCSRS